MPELGVNIDHVATVRQARRTYEPDPVAAATLCELAGADGITVHLREDRRHIQERDVRLLREVVTTRLNLELACESDVLEIACQTRPEQATLVPEKREEVTTEGGLDLLTHRDAVRAATDRLRAEGIVVSVFLDPDPRQIEAAAEVGAAAVELHTGSYADARPGQRGHQLEILRRAAAAVLQSGLLLHAGHGLNYQNVLPVAGLPEMRELNIGHAIVSRAVLVGMSQAVRDMKALLASVGGSSDSCQRSGSGHPV